MAKHGEPIVRRFRVSLSVEVIEFSLLQNVQTDCAPIRLPFNGYRVVFFPLYKTAGA